MYAMIHYSDMYSMQKMSEDLDIDDQIRPSSLIDHTLPPCDSLKCSVVVYCFKN